MSHSLNKPNAPRRTHAWLNSAAGCFILVLGGLAPAARAADVVSREVSVRNEINPPPVVMDAVSREVSVRNAIVAPPPAGDYVSREVSVRNSLLPPPVVLDAISRECSVRNDFRCTGDITGDGSTDATDIFRFARVLAGIEPHPYFQQACDMNCDGMADGRDIQLFVNMLLSP